MSGGAIISPDGIYRYRLERECGGMVTTAVIMVNPSTADHTKDDATIRKLKGFGQRNNWGKLIVGNLFAYRSTDVRKLGSVHDPIGPENDEHLMRIMADADQVIFAWGPLAKQPKYRRGRWKDVAGIAHGAGLDPYCIGTAACGHPRHPLMTPYATPVARWDVP